MTADSSRSTATSSMSHEISPEHSISQPPRLKYACEACHASKVRCTGKQPCARCTSNGWECVYKLAARIGKPKGSRNKSTLRRLQMEAEQAARESQTSPVSSSGQSPSLYQTNHTESSEGTSLNFSGPFSDSSLSSNSTHQDWIWPSDTNPWPHEADPMRTASLPSPPVQSLWGSVIESGDQVNARSMSDAAPDTIGLSSWTPEYPVPENSQETVVPSTMQELFPNPDVLSYSIEDMPASAFMPPTTTFDLSPLAPPLIADDTRQPSPFTSWTGSEAVAPAMPSAAGGRSTCSCRRSLSWQLNHLDQVRQAIARSTRVCGFLEDTIGLRQAIILYLGCQNCEKSPAGIALMTTGFANFTHVLRLVIRSVADPTAQAVRDGSYSWLSTGSGSEGAGADQLGIQKVEAKRMIDEWMEACEMAQQIVRELPIPAESQAVEGGESGKAHAAALSWSAADPTSVGEMLWRVRQSLANLA